jgi:urease beta subunit
MTSLYRLIVFGIAFIGTELIAQSNEIRISGTRMIAAGETFSVSAGSTIVMEPGASLLVDGSIKLNGSSDKRIKIISADPKNPE